AGPAAGGGVDAPTGPGGVLGSVLGSILGSGPDRHPLGGTKAEHSGRFRRHVQHATAWWFMETDGECCLGQAPIASVGRLSSRWPHRVMSASSARTRVYAREGGAGGRDSSRPRTRSPPPRGRRLLANYAFAEAATS